MSTNLKVVSLVPSWTETLLECGVNVIGRTRYCIHPISVVDDIPVVGGTKEVFWDRVQSLEPDLLILDKEENPEDFAIECPLPFHATHVQSIETVYKELVKLSELLGNQKLFNLAGRWMSLDSSPSFQLKDLEYFPGLIQWVRKPQKKIQKIFYIIWKDPWMTVSQETFIGSVLKKIGIEKYLPISDEKYPDIQLDDLDPETTLFLLATEPYPFHKKLSELAKLPFPSMIVNGEFFSWYGIRSLLFLEAQKELLKSPPSQFKLRK